MKKGFFIILVSLAGAMAANAQAIVEWKFSAVKTGKNKATLSYTATIDPGWHLYSIHQGEGGPVPTTFTLEPSGKYELTGKVVEPAPIREINTLFMMEVGYFEKEVTFTQTIKLKARQATIKGTVNFMACNEMQCIPPITTPFVITIK